MHLNRKLALPLMAWFLATVSACGGSSSGTCKDLSGVWVITAHCQASLEGQTATFQQTGCGLDITSPVAGQTVTGTVGADGSFSINVQPDNLHCPGTVAGDTIQLNCSGCAQTLQRQR
jgi:hypothetical protein